MKILILQLARFGDIYLTWPTLRALRRQYPTAEIHLLVREKFAAATNGLGEGFIIHQLPTAEILKPLIELEDGFASMIFRFDEWLEILAATSWDTIINLSFSPSSSYLVDYLSAESTKICGYTRHGDGFLAIPDDASAYFYGQVGPDRFNRYHLVDLFAMIAQTELQATDWGVALDLAVENSHSKNIVIHLGASQKEKRYPMVGWEAVIQNLSQQGLSITLIGSKDEEDLAKALSSNRNVNNLIGKTKIQDLFKIIASARLLIGADSAPIHMAAHTHTPVVNLSFKTVSYWETGPCSKGSVILDSAIPRDLDPLRIVEAVAAIMEAKTPAAALPNTSSTNTSSTNMITTTGEMGVRFAPNDISFSWALILALYTNNDYPMAPSAVNLSALHRLAESTELALVAIDTLKAGNRSPGVLDGLKVVDQFYSEIAIFAPEVAPLVNWFKTEQTRIPPGPIEQTFEKTEKIYRDMQTITSVYAAPIEGPDFVELSLNGLSRLNQIESELASCAQSFRLLEMAAAEPMLQRLLNGLTFFEKNGLHHLCNTKVEDARRSSWEEGYADYREVLSELIQAFQRKDYIFVADLIEYEIPGCIHLWRNSIVKWQENALAY
jgi:ADP-heptose:LPS heptosyltransferase